MPSRPAAKPVSAAHSRPSLLPLQQGREGKPLRVVVRGMNWLGDIIIHLTALERIKQLPHLHLTVLTPPKLAGIYQACPFVDAILETDPQGGLRSTAKRIRAGNFDLGITLPNSWRTALELFLAGVPLRAGLSLKGARPLAINLSIPNTLAAAPGEHQSFTWLRAVEWLGAPHATAHFQLPRPATSASAPAYGILAPGAEFGPAKRWMPDHFAGAAASLHDVAPHWKIVGSPGDAEACNAVAAALPQSENLCGKTSLKDLIDLLLGARLVLCNDSGVMHLAGLCATPTVAIFGSTEPRATRPVHGTAAEVRHHLPCSPCFQRTCPLGHYHCLHSVLPEEVADAARALLQHGRPARLPGLAWSS